MSRFNWNDLGYALGGAANAINQYRQQSALASLGNSLASGDYGNAARQALSSGDVNTGLSLLQLGQKQDELKQQKAADVNAFQLAGLGGSSGPPMSSPSSPGRYNFADLYGLYKQHGATDNEAATHAAIALAESRGNPMAHNTTAPDNSYGLGQINMFGKLGPERMAKFGLSSPDQLYDPNVNAQAGLAISRGPGGFNNWSTYKSGAYKQFLPNGPVQVADASGNVPIGAGTPPVNPNEVRKNNILRALMTPNLSDSARQRLTVLLNDASRPQASSIQEYEYSQTHPGFSDYQAAQRASQAGPKMVGPGGVLVDAKGKELYRNPGLPEMSDETASFMADRILAGDTHVLTGLGRGAQGAANIAKVQEMVANKARAQGLDPTDILAKTAEQSGLTAQQRTFGTQTARMATSSTEAQGAIALGRQASANVPRGNWVPVNRAIQAYQAGTSDPALAKFGAANLAIVNTYARAINPNGQPTVADKDHAIQMLSTAQGPEAYSATLDQMQAEIDLAHKSPQVAKVMLENIRKGRPAMEGIHSMPLTPEKGPFTTGGSSAGLPSGWSVEAH